MIITADELSQHLGKKDVLIIDARSFHDYSKSHRPGAINLDLFSMNLFDTSNAGIDAFNEQTRNVLSFVGVHESKKVVFYDDISGMLAARGVWLCHYFSHPDVSMLDGGFSNWSRRNFQTEISQNKPSPSNVTGKINKNLIAGFQYVLDNLNKITILDVRSKEEFNGEIVRAARVVHILTSTNVDWAVNLSKDGTLKNNEDLSTLYTISKDAEIVTYCQGAYRAANTYVTLQNIGFKIVRVYLGTWGEWGIMIELTKE